MVDNATNIKPATCKIPWTGAVLSSPRRPGTMLLFPDDGRAVRKNLRLNDRGNRPADFVLAGPGPAVHAFEGNKSVDTRIKSAQDG
jgi:hypothetical protein